MESSRTHMGDALLVSKTEYDDTLGESLNVKKTVSMF